MLTMADRDKFINDGPFFEKYPDIYPDVTRYEHFAPDGSIIESWERGNDGRMHETTQRDKLREEIVKTQEQIKKIDGEEDVYITKERATNDAINLWNRRADNEQREAD